MNISKTQSKAILDRLYEANRLIDEEAYKSAKRIIEDVISDVYAIETSWDNWRAKQ